MTSTLEETTPSSSREKFSAPSRVPWVLVLLLMSSAGPYLTGSIRADQAVTYALLVTVFIPWAAVYGRSIPGAALRVVGPWVLITAIAALQWVQLPPAPSIGAGNPVAQLDALLQPLAVFLITWSVLHRVAWRRALTVTAAVVTMIMVGNALLSAAQAAGAAPLLSRWDSGAEGVTTADLAATSGRYSGIMNQPALAGTLYGLAGVLAAYTLRRRPLLQAGAVLLLCLGGALAVSKAFLFVALPIVLVMWAINTTGGLHRLVLVATACLAGWYLTTSAWLAEWNGMERLTRTMSWLTGGDEADVSTLTAGRYGEGTAMDDLVDAVMGEQPLFGFGIQGVNAPTDTQWTHVLAIAGLVGVGLLLLMAVTTWTVWLESRAHTTPAESRLFAAILLVITGCSLGFPVLVGNRLLVVVWVILAILCKAASGAKTPAMPAT